MAREQFTQKQIDKSIFRPQEHKPTQDSISPEIIFYTITGKHDSLIDGLPVLSEDGPTAYAKKEGVKFYIKSNGGQLADPRGIYDGDIYKRIGDTPVWTWRRVNPKAFNFYIAYLKNANKSHYHNASREMF